MVVLIDTNVIIDFLVAREPFYDSALHVMEKCASGEAEGYMAFHSLPNLWYILRKVPVETRRSWLEKVCKILKVAAASQEAAKWITSKILKIVCRIDVPRKFWQII